MEEELVRVEEEYSLIMKLHSRWMTSVNVTIVNLCHLTVKTCAAIQVMLLLVHLMTLTVLQSDHPDFHTLVLTDSALEVAFIAIMAYRGQRSRAPDNLTNEYVIPK
jgi:hypothetical protein